MEILIEVLRHSLMITGFVFVMMLLIEYINVQTQGMWQDLFRKNIFLQYLLAAALGAVPGCLGAFTVVTLFSHGIISVGAVVAAMIATSGDETFVMLAMIPENALLIIAITFVVGIIAGFITDKIIPRSRISGRFGKLPIHKEEKCSCWNRKDLFGDMRHPSMQRILLIIIIIMLLAGVLTGTIAAGMKFWLKISMIVTALIALFITTTVPEHFLSEHLWEHIVKIHIPRIFLWTFGTLLVIHVLMHYIDISSWMAANGYYIMLSAVIVGLIPESGPHMVFITLFASGHIPFSILLANSIVQDGHGMIPMLAESKKGFITVKAVNLLVGAVIGFGLMALGY